MGWRRKARSVAAGDWRFKADVLGALIGVADIRKTVGRGDGGIGTLVGCVDINGVNQGATGVIYGAGLYATEASRNNMTAAAGDIVTGHSVTLLGATTAGTLNMALWTLITGVAAAGDVRKTVARYSGGPDGTLVGIVDDAGDQHNYGVCSNIQLWSASGICDVSGDTYKTGILDVAGAQQLNGILNAAGVFFYDGLYNGVTRYATGIWDGFVRYASGTLSSAGAYNATGVIYGAGNYDTEANRNSTTAAAGDIVTGHSVTLLGVTTAGALDMALWVLKTDVVVAAWVVVGHNRWTGGAAGEYPTTATTNAAHQAADLAFLNANLDEMVAANASIRAQYGCNAGTAAGSGYTYGDENPAFVLTTATGPGTFDEAARNTDPGIANVKFGLAYKIQNVPLTGAAVWEIFASPAAATDCVPIRVAAAVVTEINRASFAGELSKSFTAVWSFGSEIVKLENVNDATLKVDVLPAMQQDWTHRAGSVYKHAVTIKVGIRRRIETTDRTSTGAVDTADVTGYVNLLYEIIDLLAAGRNLPTMTETVWDSSRKPVIQLYDEAQLKQGLYVGWTHLPFIFHERAA